jgi:hypothetical protein
MSEKYVKRLILLMSILLPFLIITVMPLCHADDFPDISSLSRSYVLKNNRQFFVRDNGYVLVSTDGTKETLITMLNPSGKPDKSAPVIAVSAPFAYEQAAQKGENLYLVGKAPNREDCVKIARFCITNCSLVQNQINNVSCDFTRGLRVEEDGSFFLVTVPYGTEIDPSSPFREYVFDPNHDGTICAEKTASDSDSGSSSESSSGTESSPSSAPEPDETSSSSSSEPEASSGSSGSTDARTYVFEDTMTVEALQKQLDSEGRGAVVRVTAADGTAVKSGNVGTGSIVEVIRNGQVESRVTAIIFGDLTGSGKVTERDSVLLYEHITNQRQLTGLFFEAADINGDEKIDTSDMLEIKKRMK